MSTATGNDAVFVSNSGTGGGIRSVGTSGDNANLGTAFRGSGFGVGLDVVGYHR